MAHSHAHHDHAHHGHSHDHGDGHSHDHAHESSVRSMRAALLLSTAFLFVEAIGGWLANSLALIADAGHLLTDVAALSLSLFVAWYSRTAASPQKSYGYLRLEVLAAFVNGATLVLVSVWIVWEAVARLRHPEPLRAGLMFWVAIAGLIVNAIAVRILHPVHGNSINARGAYLHMLGDLLAAAGTVAAAIVIQLTNWIIVDPLVSIVMAALILRSAWRLVRESVDVLLEATPSHISLGAVRTQLEAIPGIESVHDLHIWTVTSNMIAMSAHAIVREPDRQQHVLEHVHDAMRLFGIEHVTVQLERIEMFEREAHLHD